MTYEPPRAGAAMSYEEWREFHIAATGHDPDEDLSMMSDSPSTETGADDELNRAADAALESMANDTRSDEQKSADAADWIVNSTLGDSPAPEVEVRDQIERIVGTAMRYWNTSESFVPAQRKAVDALTRLIDDREQRLIKDLQDAQEHDAFLIEGLIDALGPASDDVIEQIEAEFEESRS